MESVTLSRAKKSLDMAKKVADNNRQLEDGKEYPINLSIIGAEKDSVECIQGSVTFKDGVGRVSPNLFEHLGMGATLSYKNNNITLIGKDAETFAVSSNYNGINIVGREKAEKENMKDIDGNHLKKEDLNLKNVKDPKNARLQLDNKTLKQKRQEMQDLRAESNEIMNQQFQDQLRNMPRLMRILQMLEDYNYKLANSQANTNIANSGLNSRSVYDLYNLDQMHAQLHSMSTDLTQYFHKICNECQNEISDSKTLQHLEMPSVKFTSGDKDEGVTMSMMEASTEVRSRLSRLQERYPGLRVDDMISVLGIPKDLYEYAETHKESATPMLDAKMTTPRTPRASRSKKGSGRFRLVQTMRVQDGKATIIKGPATAENTQSTKKDDHKKESKEVVETKKTTSPPKGETKATTISVERSEKKSIKVSNVALSKKQLDIMLAQKDELKGAKLFANTEQSSRQINATEQEKAPATERSQVITDKPQQSTQDQTHTVSQSTTTEEPSRVSDATSTQNNPNSESKEPTVTIGKSTMDTLVLMDNMLNKDFVGPMPLSYIQQFNEVITEMQARNPESSSQTQDNPYHNPKDIPYPNEHLESQQNQSFSFDKENIYPSDSTIKEISDPYAQHPTLASRVAERPELTPSNSELPIKVSDMGESRATSHEDESARVDGERGDFSAESETLDHTASGFASMEDMSEFFEEYERNDHEHDHEHNHKIDPEILQLEDEVSQLTLAQAQELEDLDASFDERTMRFVLKHLKFSREEMKKELYDYSNILQADKSLTPAKRKQKLLLEQDKIKKRQEKEFTDKLLKQKFLQRKIYANLVLKHSLAKAKCLLKLEQLANKCKAQARAQKRTPLMDERFSGTVDHLILDLSDYEAKINAFAAKLEARGEYEKAKQFRAFAKNNLEQNFNEYHLTNKVDQKFDEAAKRLITRIDYATETTNTKETAKLLKSETKQVLKDRIVKHRAEMILQADKKSLDRLVESEEAHIPETNESLAEKLIQYHGIKFEDLIPPKAGQISRDQFIPALSTASKYSHSQLVQTKHLASFRKNIPNQTGPTGPQGPQ